MRYLLLILMIKNTLAVDVFPISKITELPDREAVFRLTTYSAVDLTLDCSSFLHGLNVLGASRNDFFLLFESECYEIINNLFLWEDAGEEACLKLDFVRKDWQLEKKAGDCR